ncbi:MAG: glycosyltransferase, partial [Planctomycetota bacterium]
MNPDAEPLRVIVNGIPMIPPRTGIGRFVHANAETMGRLVPSIRASFFYGFRLGGIEDSTRPRNWIRRLSRLPGARSVSGRILAHRIRGMAFRWLAPRGRFDLYHETNYAPFPFQGPVLCTIYDLSFLLRPETHPEDRVRLMSRRVRAAATSAARFVTISESVRREMTEHLGISQQRIDVIRPACDPAFLSARPADLEQRIRALGLPPAYLFAVGTVEPRKNFIQAYAANVKN